MICIKDVLGSVRGSRTTRNAVFFKFCCDESSDGCNPPNTITISGFFSTQSIWEDVEEKWDEINRKYGVNRFHAQPLNRAGSKESKKDEKSEYKDWCKCKATSYSEELLDVINGHGKRMRAYNCGMRCDYFREILSEEGQKKMGHPWMACFNSCIAMIAKDMETLPKGDTVSIFVEAGSGFDEDAHRAFNRLLINPDFAYRERLGMFGTSTPTRLIGLQTADLMAFEYFKRLNTDKNQMRPPYELIVKNNGFNEGFFGKTTFTEMKDDIESSKCGPGNLVIIPTLI